MTLPKIEMVPLSKLKDNPWRDKKRNPINPDKVGQIAESIISTGEFWIGVYGRRVAGGYVELAFGHHRADAAKAVDTGDVIEAAKSAGLKSIPVAIREFTDGEMLMRMTRENLRGELPIVLEAVSAAVRALGEGKIEVPEPDPKTNTPVIKYAPSFVPGKKPFSGTVPEHPYTASTIATFLGGIYVTTNKGHKEPSSSVRAALGILELEERKIPGFSWENFKGQPIRKIIPACQGIKKQYEESRERSKKSAEENAKAREVLAEKVVLQKQQEKEAAKAKLKAQRAAAEAKRDKENKELQEAKRKATEERDKLEAERKETREQIVQAEQSVVRTEKQLQAETEKSAYASTGSMVQLVLSDLGRIAVSGGELEARLKVLKNSKKGAEIKLRDRQRVWIALEEAASRLEFLKSWMENMSYKGEKNGK